MITFDFEGFVSAFPSKTWDRRTRGRGRGALLTMTSCHRAPPFPLSAANPLMEEARAALAQPLLSPEALDSLYSTMASLRREIHANPEPGFEETKTNALLRSMLTTLAGIPESAFSDCAGTGLVVDMMGEGDFLAPAGASVRTIALRADMDALRMTEGNNGLPYRSANEGVAHLCGHDGHMASLVGAAALLRRRLSRVPRDCKVRLLSAAPPSLWKSGVSWP